MGEKAAADHKFQMYDAEKGTFLGRTAISWRKSLSFYDIFSVINTFNVQTVASFLSPWSFASVYVATGPYDPVNFC